MRATPRLEGKTPTMAESTPPPAGRDDLRDKIADDLRDTISEALYQHTRATALPTPFPPDSPEDQWLAAARRRSGEQADAVLAAVWPHLVEESEDAAPVRWNVCPDCSGRHPGGAACPDVPDAPAPGDLPGSPTAGSDDIWTVAVEIPASLPDAAKDSLFTAVADAAHDWEPKVRDGWDISVTGYPTAHDLRHAEAAVERVRDLADDMRHITGARAWADRLDAVLDPPAKENP